MRRDRRRRDIRDGRRSCHPVAASLFADAQLEIVALELELAQLVFAHHVQDFGDLVEIHAQSPCSPFPQIDSSSRGTRVSTSQPLSVTSTSSSMRTPPKPDTYAPGSIVKTIPGWSGT